MEGGGCKLVILVTVGKAVSQGWSGVETHGNEMTGQEIYQQICLPESLVP